MCAERGNSTGPGTVFAQAELTGFQVSVLNLWSFQKVMHFQNYCDPHFGVERITHEAIPNMSVCLIQRLRMEYSGW